MIRTPTIYIYFDIFAKQKGEEKLGECESNIDIYTYILSCWLQNNKIYKITKSCVLKKLYLTLSVHGSHRHPYVLGALSWFFNIFIFVRQKTVVTK